MHECTYKSLKVILTFHLCLHLKEIQRLQEETDKANKHSSVLERDNQRMEVQIKDLSQQVRVFCPGFFVILTGQ